MYIHIIQFCCSFIGVTQSLPTTAYIKMIDIWMIFMMMYPFFVVSLYTLIEVLKNKKNKIQVKKAAGEWINKENQCNIRMIRMVSWTLVWGLPCLVTTFIIIYWTLGLVNYASTNVDSVCWLYQNIELLSNIPFQVLLTVIHLFSLQLTRYWGFWSKIMIYSF